MKTSFKSTRLPLLIRVLVSSLVVLTCVWGVASWSVQVREIPGDRRPQWRVQIQEIPRAPAPMRPYPPPDVSPAEFDRWMKELSNWGRWGKDDQIGTANLITAAKRKQAAALVKEGISVSLAPLPLTEETLDAGEPLQVDFGYTISRTGRTGPEKYRGVRDLWAWSVHGGSLPHIDAVCHTWYKGRMYNGFSGEKEVSKERGCAKSGIQNLRKGITTRGILIDIPRMKGVPYLEPLTPIFPQDIEAWEKKAGVKVTSGDAILLRTGRWARRAKEGPFKDHAGFHALVAPWLKARDVAVIGSDAESDLGGPLPGTEARPIHTFAIVGLGATLLDELDLEELAETAATLDRWEFLLTVAPLPVQGGTGSPINPIATF